MLQNDLTPIRHLGRISMAPGVKESLSGQDVVNALLRHTPDGELDNGSPPAQRLLEGAKEISAALTRSGYAGKTSHKIISPSPRRTSREPG